VPIDQSEEALGWDELGGQREVHVEARMALEPHRDPNQPDTRELLADDCTSESMTRYGYLALPLIVFNAVSFLASQWGFLRQAFYRSAGLARVDYSQLTTSNIITIATDEFSGPLFWTRFSTPRSSSRCAFCSATRSRT
jgi:hypothetical protein